MLVDMCASFATHLRFTPAGVSFGRFMTGPESSLPRGSGVTALWSKSLLSRNFLAFVPQWRADVLFPGHVQVVWFDQASRPDTPDEALRLASLHILEIERMYDLGLSTIIESSLCLHRIQHGSLKTRTSSTVLRDSELILPSSSKQWTR